MGYITPVYSKFPGYLSPSMDLRFEDMLSGLVALLKAACAVVVRIVAVAGFIETTGFFSGEAYNMG